MRKAAVALGGIILFVVTGCASGSRPTAGASSGDGPGNVIRVKREPRALTPARRPDAAAPRGIAAPGAVVAPGAVRPTTRPAEIGGGVTPKRDPAPARPKPTRAPRKNPTRDGLASYYAHQFHGRLTSSGERFDMRKLTAAHRTLPFGTRLRVTNLANGRSIVVRVNDRGPFVAGRALDLSLGAARQLDMVRAGVVPVRMEILSMPRAAMTGYASSR